jgi:hypothetical protein
MDSRTARGILGLRPGRCLLAEFVSYLAGRRSLIVTLPTSTNLAGLGDVAVTMGSLWLGLGRHTGTGSGEMISKRPMLAGRTRSARYASAADGRH